MSNRCSLSTFCKSIKTALAFVRAVFFVYHHAKSQSAAAHGKISRKGAKTQSAAAHGKAITQSAATQAKTTEPFDAKTSKTTKNSKD